MNAMAYVDIDQGIYKVKFKVSQNEIQKKLCSFSINMENFEAFCRNKNLNSNLFFLKNGYGLGALCKFEEPLKFVESSLKMSSIITRLFVYIIIYVQLYLQGPTLNLIQLSYHLPPHFQNLKNH